MNSLISTKPGDGTGRDLLGEHSKNALFPEKDGARGTLVRNVDLSESRRLK
jgi:hypothetical protein